MRLRLLCAGAALVGGLALSASSTDARLPSSGGKLLVVPRSHGRPMIRLMPGVKSLVTGCDYSVYAFCFYVTPGNPGPYIETSAGSSNELYNAAYIVKNKSGKIDKKFSTYFSPDPGNPTYQYIDYTGKDPKKPTAVKYTDYYCIGFSSSACTGSTYTFKLGIALQPASS